MLIEPVAAGCKFGKQHVCGGGGACWLLLAVLGKILQDRDEFRKRSGWLGNRKERKGQSPVIEGKRAERFLFRQ